MEFDACSSVEIQRVLTAVEFANRKALLVLCNDGAYARGYQAGFDAAISATALGFGLICVESNVGTWRDIEGERDEKL